MSRRRASRRLCGLQVDEAAAFGQQSEMIDQWSEEREDWTSKKAGEEQVFCKSEEQVWRWCRSRNRERVECNSITTRSALLELMYILSIYSLNQVIRFAIQKILLVQYYWKTKCQFHRINIWWTTVFYLFITSVLTKTPTVVFHHSYTIINWFY